MLFVVLSIIDLLLHILLLLQGMLICSFLVMSLLVLVSGWWRRPPRRGWKGCFLLRFLGDLWKVDVDSLVACRQLRPVWAVKSPAGPLCPHLVPDVPTSKLVSPHTKKPSLLPPCAHFQLEPSLLQKGRVSFCLAPVLSEMSENL